MFSEELSDNELGFYLTKKAREREVREGKTCQRASGVSAVDTAALLAKLSVFKQRENIFNCPHPTNDILGGTAVIH